MAKEKKDDSKKEEKKPKKAAAAAPKAKSAKGAGLVPRKSQFAGKKIKLLVNENPRRAGTLGFKSFSLYKNGMTYEEFVKAGGRRVDLAWDVEKGNVAVA